MRVISGSARRLPLKTPEGMDTRPTQDRIKETLFNMLQSDIPGCRFLDLFAGSGAIGIEALSRGASEAVFMENNPKAAAVIRDNLHSTRLEEMPAFYREIFSLFFRQKHVIPKYTILFSWIRLIVMILKKKFLNYCRTALWRIPIL